MKLLTMFAWKRSESQTEQLRRLFDTSSEWLHNDDKIHITLERQDAICVIELAGKLPDFQLRRDGEQLFADLGEALAGYILREEEPRLLRQIIRDEFHYKQEDEVDKIIEYCNQLLYSTDKPEESADRSDALIRRKLMVSEELTAYLRTHSELHLDGWLRFRLHAYKRELREVVEYAIDEFVMDRQYQEFISLLQYFVYIQEAKVPFVHLIHKGGNDFLLLDDNMEVIDTDDPEAVVTMELLEKDMNFEDMIVSTLITVSPQKIYIHTRDPDQQVIKTISQIFENRVDLCGYCRLCQNLDRSTAAEYNKF